MTKYIKYIVMLFMLFNASWLYAFSGGSGTPNDPYLIANEWDMSQINAYPDKNFLQVCDITLTGGYTAVINSLSGNYSGDGHTIICDFSPVDTSMYVYYIGFINNLTGTLSDVNFVVAHNNSPYLGMQYIVQNSSGLMENVTLRGDLNWRLQVGALAVANSGTIRQCNFEGTATSMGAHCQAQGGLVLGNTGLIEESYIKSDYMSTSAYGDDPEERFGGIACYNDGTINNCFSYIKGIGCQNDGVMLVGGIAYTGNASGVVSNCYSYITNIGMDNDYVSVGYKDIYYKVDDGYYQKVYFPPYGRYDYNEVWVPTPEKCPKVTNSYWAQAVGNYPSVLNGTQTPPVWRAGINGYPYPEIIARFRPRIIADHTLLGDNTGVSLTVKCGGSPYSIKLYCNDICTYSGLFKTGIKVDNLSDGITSIYLVTYDVSNNILSKSNVLSISKKSILNNIAGSINKNRVIIVNDTPGRYFEDNAINRKLVTDIKNTGYGVYIVANILPESSAILNTLLEP